MKKSNCIFCKIIKEEIPSRKVYETDSVYAFLDISPMNEGHTIVIPKEHYETLLDMPTNQIQPFYMDLKKIAKYLKEKLEFDGFNILQNNFKAAGQEVPHFHYHIIPRYKGDKIFKIQKNEEIATESALNQTHAKLK